jgi:hypothetical protein
VEAIVPDVVGPVLCGCVGAEQLLVLGADDPKDVARTQLTVVVIEIDPSRGKRSEAGLQSILRVPLSDRHDRATRFPPTARLLATRDTGQDLSRCTDAVHHLGRVVSLGVVNSY